MLLLCRLMLICESAMSRLKFCETVGRYDGKARAITRHQTRQSRVSLDVQFTCTLTCDYALIQSQYISNLNEVTQFLRKYSYGTIKWRINEIAR